MRCYSTFTGYDPKNGLNYGGLTHCLPLLFRFAYFNQMLTLTYGLTLYLFSWIHRLISYHDISKPRIMAHCKRRLHHEYWTSYVSRNTEVLFRHRPFCSWNGFVASLYISRLCTTQKNLVYIPEYHASK